MTDRPILFSEPMVCAILEGRKTQTRRVLTLQNTQTDVERCNGLADCWPDLDFDEAYSTKSHLKVENPRTLRIYKIFPRTKTGDRLWVREAWAQVGDNDDYDTVAYYRADSAYPAECKWRPSIHMPRWASRLTLIVSDVRIERIQDINDADAWDEGCHAPCAHSTFRVLWNKLNEKRGFGWKSNPWVIAITFKAYRHNIDQMETA